MAADWGHLLLWFPPPCRRRKYQLVGCWLWSLRCVRVQHWQRHRRHDWSVSFIVELLTVGARLSFLYKLNLLLWESERPFSPVLLRKHTHTHTHTHTQTHTHHYTSHLAAETIQSRVLLAVNKDPDNRSSWQRSAPCCVEGQEVTVTLCRDSHLTTSDHQTFVLHEKKEERMGVSHMTWLSQLGAFSPSVSCHSSRMKCVLLSHNTLITSIRSVRRWAEIQVSFWISVFVKETRDVIDPDPVVIFTV